jgi:hypothetical protein
MADKAAARSERRARHMLGDRRHPVPLLPTLGVDVGGVLVDLVAADSDTSFFGSQPLATPAVADCFSELGRLTQETFGGRVHVVSKGRPAGVCAHGRVAWTPPVPPGHRRGCGGRALRA